MPHHESLLIMIHCEENTGYAIATLEEVFFQAAQLAGFSKENIVWSFNGLKDTQNPKKIDCHYYRPNPHTLIPFLQQHKVTTVIAFDLGYSAPVIRLLKQQGVKRLVAYWGAGMGGLNRGLKLLFKKLRCQLQRHKADLFIFESEAMRLTATQGRGIPEEATRVLYLGVDTHRFSPAYGQDFYAHQQLGIPLERNIIFYSGHMEERKGVRVIMQAALALAQQNQLAPIHFVLCGNKGDEAQGYEALLENSPAQAHVTFAGYRTDIPLLMRSARIGVIASTGWDSFTLSSVEMMASGLPLIVSNLQGLAETIEPENTGFLITPGNATELAARILQLIQNPSLAQQFSVQARRRAEHRFDKHQQIEALSDLLRASHA